MTYLLRSALTCLALALPLTAQAHGAFKGIGDFYNGALHPFAVPSHALMLLAIGLLFGQQGQRWRVKLGVNLLIFAGSLLLGLLAMAAGLSFTTAPLLLGCAVLAGLATVIAKPLPGFIGALLAGLGGFLIGIDSAPDPTGTWKLLLICSGTLLGACLGLIYLWGMAAFLCEKKDWRAVLVRVIGSWLTASALLVLVLQIRGFCS